jgi:hypothetical protein
LGLSGQERRISAVSAIQLCALGGSSFCALRAPGRLGSSFAAAFVAAITKSLAIAYGLLRRPSFLTPCLPLQGKDPASDAGAAGRGRASRPSFRSCRRFFFVAIPAANTALTVLETATTRRIGRAANREM